MRIFILATILLLAKFSYNQSDDYYNPLQPVMQFLQMNSNARIGGFGEIGVVSSDFYQDAGLDQNPALLSKNTRNAGGSLSYAPWMRDITSIMLGEVNGFYAISTSNAVGYHFKLYHSPGVQFTDEQGQPIESSDIIQFAHQITYNHSFKNGISVGGALNYFRSDLGLSSINGIEIRPANAFAIDVGFNYGKKFNPAEIFSLYLNTGICINDFGNRVKYTDDEDQERDFIPTTIRLGLLLSPEIKLPSNFTIAVDLAYQLEKLLIPTPPVYGTDSTGHQVIEKGRDPNISPFRALHQSFYDAPYGFDEEVHEIIHKFGGEFRLIYNRTLYMVGRVGKFIEHESKGGRNYLTWGAGIGIYGFSLDYKNLGTSNRFLAENWAITFGFRTTLTKPLLRF